MIDLIVEEGFIPFWNVRVDGQVCARIRKSAFSRASFRENLEVGEITSVLTRLACLYALRLLAKQSYHSHTLRLKLTSAGFPLESSDRAIFSLQEKGYLDDAAYCQRKIEGMKRVGKSPKEIAYRLKQKGIKAGPFQTDESESLSICLNKKYPQWKTLIQEPKLRAKLFQALLRRGFSLDSVRKIIAHDLYEE